MKTPERSGSPVRRRANMPRSVVAAVLLTSLIVLVGPILLSGCGGSSAGPAPSTSGSTPGGGGNSSAAGTLDMTVKWPQVQANVRSAKLIPAASDSILVEVLQGTTPVAWQCIERPTTTAQLAGVPAGPLEVVVSAYPDACPVVASGPPAPVPAPTPPDTAQAAGAVNVTVAPGGQTNVSVILSSTIDHLALSPSAPAVAVGQSASETVTAYDSAGNVVLVAPANWQWTITPLSPASQAAASVSGSGASATLSGVLAGSATLAVTESESGKSASAVVSVTAAATPSPSPTPSSGPPANGVYRITPVNQPTMAVEMAGMGNSDGTTTDINAWTGGSNQEWLVQAQSDGSYKLYAYSEINSLQMLDYGGITTNGQVVHSWEDLAADGESDVNQRWWFVSVGNGAYRLVPYNAGQSGNPTLDVTGGQSAGAGSSLQIWSYGGGTNQQYQLTPIASPAVLVNPKKGLPTTSGSVGNANLVAAAGMMHCSWIYNWSMDPPANIPAGIEFVPQLWGWYSSSPDTNATNEILSANPTATHVLGFNEPDEATANGGSNMTLGDGLTGFQYVSALKAYGYAIGSPACADDSGSWMSSFMSQAVAAPYDYHIDFVCFHNYVGDTTGSAASADVLGFLDYVHSLYPSYPIWITECGASNLPNTTEGQTFVRLVCQGFESRSYVQRYCLFSSQPPSSSGFGAYALVNTDGSLTAAGNLYGRL